MTSRAVRLGFHAHPCLSRASAGTVMAFPAAACDCVRLRASETPPATVENAADL